MSKIAQLVWNIRIFTIQVNGWYSSDHIVFYPVAYYEFKNLHWCHICLHKYREIESIFFNLFKNSFFFLISLEITVKSQFLIIVMETNTWLPLIEMCLLLSIFFLIWNEKNIFFPFMHKKGKYSHNDCKRTLIWVSQWGWCAFLLKLLFLKQNKQSQTWQFFQWWNSGCK